jgi:hypothetical protein
MTWQRSGRTSRHRAGYRSLRTHGWIAMAVFCVALTVGRTGGQAQQARAADATLTQAQVQAVLKDYCVSCHNTKLKTGALELESRILVEP